MIFWFGRMVFVGLSKLFQSPKTKLPWSLRLRTLDVELEVEEAFPKRISSSKSSLLELMTREAETVTGELRFADHTTGSAASGTLVNQTEKV